MVKIQKSIALLPPLFFATAFSPISSSGIQNNKFCDTGFLTVAQSSSRSPSLNASSLQRLKKGFDRSTGNGTAILDTDSFFPEANMRSLFTKFPKPATVVIDKGSQTFVDTGDILSAGKIQRLSKEELEPFKIYLDWLVARLNEGLPQDERVSVSSADLRVNERGGESNKFPDWHLDGEYLAAAVSLLGPGTQYRLGKNPTPYETAVGKTLVFSATDRSKAFPNTKATLHRSPPGNQDRMFLIIRFKRKKQHAAE